MSIQLGIGLAIPILDVKGISVSPPQIDYTAFVDGIEITSGLGDVTLIENQRLSVTNVSATSGLGTALAFGIGSVAVLATGAGATGSVGTNTVVAKIFVSVSVTNNSITSGLGNETVLVAVGGIAVVVNPTTVSATSGLGNESVTAVTRLLVTAVTATSGLGNESVTTQVNGGGSPIALSASIPEGTDNGAILHTIPTTFTSYGIISGAGVDMDGRNVIMDDKVAFFAAGSGVRVVRATTGAVFQDYNITFTVTAGHYDVGLLGDNVGMWWDMADNRSLASDPGDTYIEKLTDKSSYARHMQNPWFPDRRQRVGTPSTMKANVRAFRNVSFASSSTFGVANQLTPIWHGIRQIQLTPTSIIMLAANTLNNNDKTIFSGLPSITGRNLSVVIYGNATTCVLRIDGVQVQTKTAGAGYFPTTNPFLIAFSCNLITAGFILSPNHLGQHPWWEGGATVGSGSFNADIVEFMQFFNVTPAAGIVNLYPVTGVTATVSVGNESVTSTGTFNPLTLNATNTGHTGVLTASGNITTSANGQTIQNKDVTGRITVNHANVTITNCRVTEDNYYCIIAAPDTNNVSGLTVHHCTLTGGVNGIAGVGTFYRNNIFGVDNGINVWEPSLIYENYIHDLGSILSAIDGSGHNDGIENNGSGMTLLRNRIEVSNENDTSACMTNNEFGLLNNILIDGNYISGGQYTLYADTSKNAANMPVVNYVVTNNTFVQGRVGYFALYDSGIVIGPTNILI